ncbi:MAG: DUF3795 domain-containing protein [Candidatus Shapirobacteria bacterium]|nr:DUF3795 domain-containing protein [Candidatus Shapirobacteria bacterium]
MKPSLIAPCGMNCGICLHFLRANNKCPGCSSGRKVNGKCIKCAIKICQERQGEYCFNCDKFPCERLKRMDKRYQEKYETSLLNNLENIKKNGIKSFIINQEKKWVNSAGTLCVHDKKRY